jgi:hypothetical protein
LITELLLLIIKGIVLGFLALMPVMSLPVGFLNGIAGVIELLATASIFMPVSIFLACTGWFILLYNTSFFMSIVNWIIAKIPTIN